MCLWQKTREEQGKQATDDKTHLLSSGR